MAVAGAGWGLLQGIRSVHQGLIEITGRFVSLAM